MSRLSSNVLLKDRIVEISEIWNESESCKDVLTGRHVRRLTSSGRINQTPTYHTNSGFTADGRHTVFASVREQETWIVAAETETGDLKLLWKTEGLGDRNYIHRCMSLTFDDVDGRGICGNRVCVAPMSGIAVFCVEKRIVAVDIDTCETTVLLENCGDEWIFGAPCISPDEKHAAITLSSSHPEMRNGNWTLTPEKHYREYLNKLRLIRVPLNGSGNIEIMYEHPVPAQSAHCAYCPSNKNLLYFDLDLPPRYWGGSDKRTPRIWMLDIDAGTISALKKEYPGSFQTHSAWLWDGSAICYHGGSKRGGEYFGVTKINGEVLWEEIFPHVQAYGHNTPDARKQALIIDGMFSTDRLQWLYWGKHTGGVPRLEPICIHGTEWGGLPGQYSHPHPLTDASGNWISFTSARGGRSDVYVVNVET